jgi:hypothetical protein
MKRSGAFHVRASNKNPVSWSDSIIKEDRDIVLSYLKEKTKGDVMK